MTLTPRAPRLPTGLDTPALVIDLDVVERNASRMARAMAERGVAVRPHVKTHKSVNLARVQLAAGARGITVGTLGEAEVMAAAGIDDIFIAYAVAVEGAKAERLRTLLRMPGLELTLGVDSVAGASRLAALGALRVMVELDSGQHRTGVPPETAGEIGRAARDAGLNVIGLFTHGGHSYGGPDAVARAAADEVQALSMGAQGLLREGIAPNVLSAGSSPTAVGAARRPVTELRPGTYLVGDRQQVALGASPPDGVAIAVAATVVSTAVRGQVVIDAGAKALTKDQPAYLAGYGFLPEYPDGVLERISDYHGVVTFPAGVRRPALGEVVAVVPNHACPVIDLYDSFVAARAGEFVERWPVDARGRSG
jgi:D-serine deaminase-like pyridoxal phosphate-dependent protein